MLTEQRFVELYRLAQELHASGADAAARELYFHLFDRGGEAGGYGVVRLTFVLRELAELARPARDGQNGQDGRGDDAEATHALDGLLARRDAREAAAERGDAGFVVLQELVALNRALGEGERSYRLYRTLHERSAGGGERAVELSATVHVLGELVREELVPRDPERLARAIFHERLRARVAEAAAVAAELLEERVIGGETAGGGAAGGETAAGHREATRRAHRLMEIAAEARRLAEDLLEEARREDAEVPREMVELCRETEKVLEPARLRACLVHDETGRQALAALRGETDELVRRHLPGAEAAAEELQGRVVGLAGEVAQTIAAERVREDFVRRRLSEDGDRELAGWTEQKVRGDGLLVYEVLLRVGEVDVAENLANWLLAYRQDEDMYLALIAAARRADQTAVVDRLNEEAQRALVGGG